jgi:cell division protease FtsH
MGDITTGASNDIERSTKLARQMVTQYGMSDKLGPMTLGDGQHEVFLGRDFSATPNYSQEIAFEIDKEVRRLIDDAYETATRILTERRELLELMADVLVERETVDKDQLEALLDGRWAEYLEEEKAREAAAPPAEPEAEVASEPSEPADDRPIVEVPPAGAEGAPGLT